MAAALPTPTGVSPLPNLTSPTQTSRAQAVAGYVAFLESEYGAQLAGSFQAYAGEHPSQTANAALNSWANVVAQSYGPNFASALKEAVEEDANATSQAASGTVAGLDATEKSLFGGVLGFLSDLTSGQFWVRAGEVVAGLILLGIGLNAMLKGKPLQVVTGAAGTVGKAAML
jgi:hypothetical protein